MYGRRRYSHSKDVKKSEVPPEAVPTFICPKCKSVRSTASGFVELTVLHDNKLLQHNKLCDWCFTLFEEWIKGK
jgi:hypothetical protein